MPIRIWHDPHGEGFCLELYKTKRTTNGKNIVKYILKDKRSEIFNKEFCCSPLHLIDSDETVASVIGWCSLKPGDTDKEFFDNYSPRQISWMQERAELLSYYSEADSWKDYVYFRVYYDTKEEHYCREDITARNSLELFDKIVNSHFYESIWEIDSISRLNHSRNVKALITFDKWYNHQEIYWISTNKENKKDLEKMEELIVQVWDKALIYWNE